MNRPDDYTSLPLIVVSVVFATICYYVHSQLTGPIAHVPGPWTTKFSSLSYQIATFKGTRHYHLKALHGRYGGLVRTGPKDVSVADLDAVKTIFRTNDLFLKSSFYTKFVIQPSIFSLLGPHQHAQWRKLLGPSMNESSVKKLQPVVQAKVDLLIAQMKKERTVQGYTDMWKWLHYFTTDVIGDLSFGRSFQTLEKGEEDSLIKAIKGAVPLAVLRTVLTSRSYEETESIPFPPFSSLKKHCRMLDNFCADALNEYRIHVESTSTPRRMFFDQVMATKNQEAGMTDTEIGWNAVLYMLAGTDTTAFAITYILWLLLEHPKEMAKLKDAIERADLPEHPTNEQLRDIQYLECIMNETLRVYPPAAGPLPRVVPAGGRTVGGVFMPEGTVVSPNPYVLSHHASLYPDPESWIPERWENATKAMIDGQIVFGGGTRSCMGMPVAKMEIRLVVVGFLRSFENPQVAYGVDAYQRSDMEQREFIVGKPKGGKFYVS